MVVNYERTSLCSNSLPETTPSLFQSPIFRRLSFSMKILLMNYILGGQTGSETWTATMADELEIQGHEVDMRTDASKLPDVYDLAIINHNTCLTTAQHLTCKKIFTSHGVLPDLEQPVAGADVYVAVSEEVQQNLKDKGFESTIIRNGIDYEHFHPYKPVNRTLKNVLFSSNYQSNAESIIRDACNRVGANFTRIGGQQRTTQVLHELNKADLVIGLGRTSYEAMSCARNVIVYDYNGGDGFVTPHTVFKFRTHNCSGRYNRHQYTADDLVELFKRYDPDIGRRLRNYIYQNNNVEKTAKQYLNL